MTELQKFNEVVAYCKKIAPKYTSKDGEWTRSGYGSFLKQVHNHFKKYKAQWISSGGGFEHILVPLDEHNHISVNPVTGRIQWTKTRKAFKDAYNAFWHETQSTVKSVDF